MLPILNLDPPSRIPWIINTVKGTYQGKNIFIKWGPSYERLAQGLYVEIWIGKLLVWHSSLAMRNAIAVKQWHSDCHIYEVESSPMNVRTWRENLPTVHPVPYLRNKQDYMMELVYKSKAIYTGVVSVTEAGANV